MGVGVGSERWVEGVGVVKEDGARGGARVGTAGWRVEGSGMRG